MRNIVVGISDCQFSTDPDSSLITYALGSCIAVAIYDPIARVGGLLHYLLPDSKMDPEKGKRQPFVFADTGIPALFKQSYELGAVKNRLRVSVAGGAQFFQTDTFEIGKRNQLAMKKILWRAGVLIHQEEVGGHESRTIRMEMDTGRVLLKTAGGPELPIGSTKSQEKEVAYGV